MFIKSLHDGISILNRCNIYFFEWNYLKAKTKIFEGLVQDIVFMNDWINYIGMNL